MKVPLNAVLLYHTVAAPHTPVLIAGLLCGPFPCVRCKFVAWPGGGESFQEVCMRVIIMYGSQAWYHCAGEAQYPSQPAVRQTMPLWAWPSAGGASQL